ncbi:MAG: hypothetical protein BHW52_08230 [Ruminococcus sp. 37_24]|nr:MAG: hypothetical protein BHW52_08230 [Ruminococcus sp. 37_24]
MRDFSLSIMQSLHFLLLFSCEQKRSVFLWFVSCFLVTRQEMNKKKDLFQFIFYVNRDYQFFQEDNQQKHQNNQLFFLMM